MTSRDGSERPPGGTETYYDYKRDNVKSFPELPIGSNVKSFSQPNGCNVKSFSNSNQSNDQSMASATDLFKSMTMNEIAVEHILIQTNLIF